MEPVDNNIFEVKSNLKSKRKRVPNSNVFLNPGLDLLANEDPMCNNAMEITPGKRRKRTKSCDIIAFENTALDLGISRSAVNEFLIRELDNVRKNVRKYESPVENTAQCSEPLYANLTETQIDPINSINNVFDLQNAADTSLSMGESDSGISIIEQRSLNTVTTDLNTDINNVTNIQSNITNQIFVNNTSNMNLSFIDRLALNSPSDNQSLYLDDDLNESNIMEIKTITIVTKKKRIQKKCTNPFLDPNLKTEIETTIENPFNNNDETKSEMEYNIEAITRPVTNNVPVRNIIPRTLFTGDTNSTMSTVNESIMNTENVYENIDSYRAESPVYENIEETNGANYNKQSKILGHDVSRFSAVDILNLNKNNDNNITTDSNDSKNLKNIFKINKLSKKVIKTLKKTFKSDKVEHNVTLNPYEVPRKPAKSKTPVKESGIENPGLNLDNSDEIEIEEIEEENEYETIKTIRNTRLNMNVTPLKERTNDVDLSNTKPNTPGKKVRFDSTLNREKIITGDSFEVQSPGLDAKIDNYHDELENCINEKKFLQQNM